MYQQKFFENVSREEIEKEIRREGFEPFLFSNVAGYRYEFHQHPTEKLLVFLEGSITVKAGDKTYECRAGDKLLIPGNVEHEAKVGPEGCVFFWSER